MRIAVSRGSVLASIVLTLIAIVIPGARAGRPDLPSDPTLLLVGAAGGATDIYVHGGGTYDATDLTNTASWEADPAISPDGLSIAFSQLVGGHWQLAIMNWDGSGISILTSGKADVGSPAWSPDGSTIAFQRSLSGRSRVYLIGVDGTALRPVTQGPADRHPSWSPDGAGIAFSHGIPRQVGPLASIGPTPSGK